MNEGFESAWPATGWDIADLSSSEGGEYLFGKRDCHPHTGATTASGTYDAVLETYYPYYCRATRSGTWTATTP